MSVEICLYVSGVVWLAASLQGVTGFGFMMLALPGLILGFPAQVVVPGMMLIYLPLGTAQTVQLRQDVDWRVLAWLTASAVLTIPAGAAILRDTDTETMQRGIGGLMVVMALLLQLNPGTPFRRERTARVGAGMISGVLAASTAVSGPPVVLLGLKQGWEMAHFRATLLAYFLAVSLCCLPFHWEMDVLNRASLVFALSGMPGAILGFFTGVWLRRRVGGKGFRWVAVAMVMCGGVAAVAF